MVQENLTVEFYDGKQRQIRVILPDDYQTSDRKYPVLYMFDGQNLFNPEDSFTGTTWEVREALEKLLLEKQVEPMVLVGIDHAEEKRLTEYSPWDLEMTDGHIEGEGVIFSEFIINKLIPHLEAKYPIQTEPTGRTLAGSSMGALISAFIAMTYPNTFGHYGIFSLCSWVNPEALTNTIKQVRKVPQAVFFVQVGRREGYNSNTDTEDLAVSNAYLQDTIDFVDQLKDLGIHPDAITLRIGEGDWHSESSWRQYMPDFLRWIQL